MRVPVVVVAAHPDDETIGAAGVLLRTSRAAVVHVTDGAPRDPRLRPPGLEREAYARLRRQEALAALSIPGLPRGSVLSLGVVDQEAADAIVPIARDLARILAALAPRVVVTHAVEGGHPDHDATGLAARAAAALAVREGGVRVRAVEMTSYHLRDGRLETGAFLPGGAPVREAALAPGLRDAKRRMLAAYASQRDVLAPFSADVERFRDAPPPAVPERPHAGALHYEAMGWTTFERFRDRVEEALRVLELAPQERTGCR